MQTLTQVFYSKLATYSREALQSKEGKALIEKAAILIRQKEGHEEEKYFRNLMSIAEVIE